jgi:hypothetical protein
MLQSTLPAAGYGYDRVQVIGDGADAFAAHAILALEARAGLLPAASLPPDAARLIRAPLHYIAMQCLAHAGEPVNAFASPLDLVERALSLGPQVPVGIPSASGFVPPGARPGSFPNILSALANKILDRALETANPSYLAWTGELEDHPNFKETPLPAISDGDALDEVLDGEASRELGLSEEVLSSILVRRFSNYFPATPVLFAGDDLQAFRDGLVGLQAAWDNTINRGCLWLLVSNVELLDGFDLFDDTNHGNDITAGGAAPGTTSWQGMQTKAAAQRGIGSKGYVRAPLAIALIPPKHLIAAQTTFAGLQSTDERSPPPAASNVFHYPGVGTIVYEPELQAASADTWYGLCRPQPGGVNATIVRVYFRGWGKLGRRQQWYNPNTRCWNFELEGRVALAAKQYRTIVRNDGTA